MTLLNGGSGKRAVASMTATEYIDVFIESITPREWRMLRGLPPLHRKTQLVAIVAAMRQASA